MADEAHLKILNQGVDTWNEWRTNYPEVKPDLQQVSLIRADLSEANLSEVNFSAANLGRANLTRTDLRNADFSTATLIGADFALADLSGADFTNANLSEASLSGTKLVGATLDGAKLNLATLRWADFSQASLQGTNLTGANLAEANLTEANLIGADLSRVSLVETILERAKLTACRVYGISIWNAKLAGAEQTDLIITPRDEAEITVDNIQVAQFIYLLLNNVEIRRVIDTMTSKVVLILGRFTPERKMLLDKLRDELRRHNYLPILFDFEKPASRDLTETISTLAHLARFVIADLTDARSIPQELQAIVPQLPSVAIQPIIDVAQHEYAMFEHFERYPWVLPMYEYETQDALLTTLPDKVIQPAEDKTKELRPGN